MICCPFVRQVRYRRVQGPTMRRIVHGYVAAATRPFDVE